MDANHLNLFLLNISDEAGKGEASSLQEADLPKNISGVRAGKWGVMQTR
jgi:hypothetical protein